MKLSTKAVLAGWVILFIALGSLVYSAYSKLKPDSLISLFNSQIQRTYPLSNLSIGKIDYVFSIDFKLCLKNFIPRTYLIFPLRGSDSFGDLKMSNVRASGSGFVQLSLHLRGIVECRY